MAPPFLLLCCPVGEVETPNIQLLKSAIDMKPSVTTHRYLVAFRLPGIYPHRRTGMPAVGVETPMLETLLLYQSSYIRTQPIHSVGTHDFREGHTLLMSRPLA